jgi:hypothetical protein
MGTAFSQQTIRLAGIKLGVESATDAPTWIQVAEEGRFDGHPAGPFEFNADVFDKLIENFRKHPAYGVGADGRGNQRVIAFDFHHASESEPTSVAVMGAPAAAWALELEKRQGADGKWQLWALTDYLEPARTYIREGKYRWTSVAVWPDAVDPKTGQSIGWYMSSIAFTNDPFIQGMCPIAANRTSAAQPATKENDMGADEKKIHKLVVLLAGRFGIPADDEAVEKRLLAEMAGADQAVATLKAILGAIGVQDAEAAVKRVADMMRASKQLEEAMPQLAALAEMQVGEEEKKAEEEVQAAMQAHRMPDVAKAALLHLRRGGVALDHKLAASNPEAFRSAWQARQKARETFAKEYPTIDASKVYLTRSLATTPDDGVVSPVLRSIRGGADGGVSLSRESKPGAAKTSAITELDQYAGRNTIEKAMSFIRAERGGDRMSLEQLHEQACKLVRGMKTAG